MEQKLIGSELPLVQRLRKMQGMGDYQLAALMDGVGPQAADEIERLQREVDVQAYWGERWVQQHEECQRLRKQLIDVNQAAHSLASLLCGVGVVAEQDGHELIRRESVMELVTRWRMQWDKAVKTEPCGACGAIHAPGANSFCEL